MGDNLGLTAVGVRAKDPVACEVILIRRHPGRATVGRKVQPAVTPHIDAAVNLAGRIVSVWQVKELLDVQ